MNNGDLKPRLKRLLESHTGRHRAIKRRHILDALMIDPKLDRKVRLTIAELRHDGFPVLLATDEPAGYYLPQSLAELHEGMDKMRSYIKSECIVLRDLKVKGRMFVQNETQGKLI